MSFITRIGQDAGKDHKLMVLRKKYFRDILQFNQGWQQEKKEEQVKTKAEEHVHFTSVANREIRALQIEKQQLRRQKANNQDMLKYDYQKQMNDRVRKYRQQKQKDKEYTKLQAVENDKVSQRRMLDFMKMYDRRAVKHSSHRRIKTEATHTAHNPEAIDQSDQTPRHHQYQPHQHDPLNQEANQIRRLYLNHQGHQAQPIGGAEEDKSREDIQLVQKRVEGQIAGIRQEFKTVPERPLQLPLIEKPRGGERVESRKQGSRSVKYLPPRSIF